MTARAEAVRDAWETAGRDLPCTVATARGSVTIERLEYVAETPERPAHVEVWVAHPACGDPHFVLFNPPTLVRDSGGQYARESTSARGRTSVRRFRVDPVGAVAEAVAMNGGASR